MTKIANTGAVTVLVTLVVATLGSAGASTRDAQTSSRAEAAARRWGANPSARAEAYLERGWRQSPRALAAAFLEDFWHLSGAPAISVAVVADGELVFSRGVGNANLEHMVRASGTTVYNVGSVSKAISAVAVMQLIENGAVGIDDPIQEYVPSFPEKRWPVTVQQVLTHTSGIRHYRDSDFPDESDWNMNRRPYETFEEAVGIFAADPLLFQPGSHYLYTSYGANLMQGIVETASGLGFEEYLRSHVFARAGMRRTFLDRTDRIIPGHASGYLVTREGVCEHPWEDLSYKWAGGGMVSTVEDLVQLGRALLEGTLLEPATVAEMFRPRLDSVLEFHGEAPPTPLRWRQAYMWRIRADDAGRDYVHACGTVEGFNACLAIYPAHHLVVALADNAAATGLHPVKTIAGFFLDAPDGSTGRSTHAQPSP